MEFDAVVHKVLEPVKGVSARGEWTKQEVIFELPGEFSRKVCVTFWGDKAQDGASLREGEQVNVSVNVESKEYNGRWFTEVRAWKIAKKSPEPIAPPMGDMPDFAPMDAGFAGDDKADDLPF